MKKKSTHGLKWAAPLCLILVLLLSGCSQPMLNGGTSSQETSVSMEQMGPEDLLDYAGRVYVNAYDSYLEAVTSPGRTEADNEFLRKKKKALKDVETAMRVLRSFTVSGNEPPADITNELIKAIKSMTGGK